MVSKARIRLSGTNPQGLDSICGEITKIADKTGVKLRGPIPLPTKKLNVPTRKSPCGQGTHTWDKWEMRIHKRLIDISEYNNETIEELQKLDLPAGIDVEIQAFGTGE